MSGQLAGKVALVTGAGKGIGAAIARGYAAEGAEVFLLARTAVDLEAVAARITAAGGVAHALVADIADPDSLRAAYALIMEKAGRLDVLMANAGIGTASNEVGKDPELNGDPNAGTGAWRRVVEVNLVGAYESIRLARPLLERSASGKVIVMGSGAGHQPIKGMSAYCAAKAGLWMLVRVLAEDYRHLGVSVNELIPGPVATERLASSMNPANASPTLAKEWVKTPEDVVPMAVFLAAQPDGGGPTGQSFALNRRPL